MHVFSRMLELDEWQLGRKYKLTLKRHQRLAHEKKSSKDQTRKEVEGENAMEVDKTPALQTTEKDEAHSKDPCPESAKNFGRHLEYVVLLFYLFIYFLLENCV